MMNLRFSKIQINIFLFKYFLIAVLFLPSKQLFAPEKTSSDDINKLTAELQMKAMEYFRKGFNSRYYKKIEGKDEFQLKTAAKDAVGTVVIAGCCFWVACGVIGLKKIYEGDWNRKEVRVEVPVEIRVEVERQLPCLFRKNFNPAAESHDLFFFVATLNWKRNGTFINLVFFDEVCTYERSRLTIAFEKEGVMLEETDFEQEGEKNCAKIGWVPKDSKIATAKYKPQIDAFLIEIWPLKEGTPTAEEFLPHTVIQTTDLSHLANFIFDSLINQVIGVQNFIRIDGARERIPGYSLEITCGNNDELIIQGKHSYKQDLSPISRRIPGETIINCPALTSRGVAAASIRELPPAQTESLFNAPEENLQKSRMHGTIPVNRACGSQSLSEEKLLKELIEGQIRQNEHNT